MIPDIEKQDSKIIEDFQNALLRKQLEYLSVHSTF